jgi:hypothetical protein
VVAAALGEAWLPQAAFAAVAARAAGMSSDLRLPLCILAAAAAGADGGFGR